MQNESLFLFSSFRDVLELKLFSVRARRVIFNLIVGAFLVDPKVNNGLPKKQPFLFMILLQILYLNLKMQSDRQTDR
jgi:hypothetical protein